jgi:hypothetical protein
MLFTENRENREKLAAENPESRENRERNSAENSDPEYRAYTVLALLDASLVSHLLAEGWSWDRIRAGVEQEARR